MKPSVLDKEEKMWSKEFPKVNGRYWVRFMGYGTPTDPELYEVADGTCRTETSAFSGTPGTVCGEWEFLGPINASDTEELLALREAAEVALTELEFMLNAHPERRGGKYEQAAAQLRKALGK